MASVADRIITHPNVLNGAMMYWPIENALYVEGSALDAFAAGRLALSPPSPPRNQVGLVLDAALDDTARIRHLQVADAARATLGLSVPWYAVTDKPLGVELSLSESGSSWGTLQEPGSLLRAAQRLVDNGADAVAIVAKFPDDEDEDMLAAYREGEGVDAIAGAEAVISHLVTRELGVPCAHAPGLPALDADESVSPKAAAEELGYTFLSCVLVGLSRAPRLVHNVHAPRTEPEGPATGQVADSAAIVASDVNAVVLPADCFGSPAVLSLAERDSVLLIAVDENKTAINVAPQTVGIAPSRVVRAKSYAEAAGFMAAHKAGIDIAALHAHVPRTQLIT